MFRTPDRSAFACLRFRTSAILLLAFVVTGSVPIVSAQGAAGPIFPQPFLVEHHIAQTDADGGVFAMEPVTDYYGGSWIVSVRADGGRTVLDLSQREVMEIDPSKGSYSVLSFDRWAELGNRLRQIEGMAVRKSGEEIEPAELQVRRVARGSQEGAGKAADSPRAMALLQRHGVEHLRVSVADAGSLQDGPVLDAWVDARVQLGERALTALEDFEDTVLGDSAKSSATSFAKMLAAARREADGALILLTSRAQTLDGDPAVVGTIEDIALRVEARITFPHDLVQVPEGFERVPHVLEVTVAWAEEDAELRRRMTDVN